LKDAFKLWRMIVKAKAICCSRNRAKGSAYLFLTLERMLETRINYCIRKMYKSLEVNQLEVAKGDLVKAFNSLQKSVQSTQTKYRLGKLQESESNNAYLEDLKRDINSIETLLAGIGKKKAEIEQEGKKQETIKRTLRKLKGVAKIIKLFISPINLDCHLVGHFFKWRFRCISAKSGLLTEDINKCFAKYRKTMLVLLNRRILNKIIGHFHHFLRGCAIITYRHSEGYKHKLGIKVCKIVLKRALEKGRNNVKWALSEWRMFIRKDIRDEYRRKQSIINIVLFINTNRKDLSEGNLK